MKQKLGGKSKTKVDQHLIKKSLEPKAVTCENSDRAKGRFWSGAEGTVKEGSATVSHTHTFPQSSQVTLGSQPKHPESSHEQ